MTAHDEQTEAGGLIYARGETHAFINGARGSQALRAAGIEALRAEGWLSPEEVAAERRTAAADAWDEGHRHCFHVENPNNPIKGNPHRAAAIRATDTTT